MLHKRAGVGDDDIRVITAALVEDSVLREAAEPFGDRRYAVLSTTRTGSPRAHPGAGTSPRLVHQC